MRHRSNVPKSVIEDTIVALCQDRFLSVHELAAALNRLPHTLRNHYLGRMARSGRLDLRYPGNPFHPKQGYRAPRP